ncbi:MAG TPA: hypothetical protein DEQ26_12405 [Flavobacteriaceae bacterium]|nr:hypothetical protein [Flavobacteriaceae bacterium]
MKKILFSLLTITAFSTNAFSQDLIKDNFESYTIGNLGSQGGWARDGGSANMARVANIDTAHGKSFQFASTSSNVSGVWIYKELDWNSRTSGNDIFSVEYDVYVPSTAAEIQLYDTSSGGYYIINDILLSPQSGAYLVSQEDFDNDTQGELLTTAIVANTWYKVSYTYNPSNGEVKIKIGDTQYGPFYNESDLIPSELDLVATGTNTAGFDNIVVSAVSNDLATTEVLKSKVSLYPNPVEDSFKIDLGTTLNKANVTIELYDMVGKKVQSFDYADSYNISSLPKGVYVLKINDGATKVVKKIVKK